MGFEILAYTNNTPYIYTKANTRFMAVIQSHLCL